MRFVSVASREQDSAKAFAECTDRLLTSGVRPDLALLFVSMDHVKEGLDALSGKLRAAIGARTLIGCTGEGLIGGGTEHEGIPAVVALAAEMPGTRLQPFAFTQEELEATAAGELWKGRVDAAPGSVFLLLADPYSIDVERVLHEIDVVGAPAAGGNASGGPAPGTHVLFTEGGVRMEGAVGVALAGGFRYRSLVAQGCRPIGKHLVITEAKENVIVKLGGKPALTYYRVRQRFGDVTLLECRLATGRTHQIRVHMHSIGHPLVGDPVYRLNRGRRTDAVLDAFPRQALHAWGLAFVHPASRKTMQFESPLPADMRDLLSALQ